MNRTRPLWRAITVAIATCSVATACAVTSAGVSKPPPAASANTLTPVSTANVSTANVSTANVSTANVSTANVSTTKVSTANKGGGKRITARLPADFPAAVRLYPGVLQGSTGRSPRWSVLIFVRAGAARVQKSAIAFYVARGYHADSRAVVHNARYRLTMLAANRDHSATQTNLTIAVAKR